MKTERKDKDHSKNRRCLNDVKGAFSSERYYASILSDQIYLDESVLQDNHGGVIIFPRNMNPLLLSNHYIVNLLMTKSLTIAGENLSCSIAKALHVKYKDRVTGEVFDEHSLSIVLLGVTTDVMLDVAEKLCDEFDQRTVLFKNYENNDIWCVN